MELTELKAIVNGLVQHARGTIKLVELDTEFKKIEGGCLKVEAARLGFASVTAMINSWSKFTVQGYGLATTILIKNGDHIFEMNKRSKNSGKKRRSYGFKPLNEPVVHRTLYGKDPYEFSSDTQSEHSSDEWGKVPQIVTTPAQVTQARTLNIALTKISPCLPIDNIQELKQIVLLEQQSPHLFWFADHNQSKKLLQMTKEMTQVYDKEGGRLKVSMKDFHVGQFVAVKFHAMWNRAKVVKMRPQGQVRVFYVDFGTAEDVAKDSVRYLLEDFVSLPAVALRGVLSHVQPTNGQWSDESKQFFFDALYHKKTASKILKYDDSKNCYFLAIKLAVAGPEHLKMLLTELMIEKDFCTGDLKFFSKENYTNDQDFSFYEEGNHLKDVKEENSWLTAVKAAEEENWLPTEMTSSPVVSQAPPIHPKSIAGGVSRKSPDSDRTSFSFSQLEQIRSKIPAKVHHVIDSEVALEQKPSASSSATVAGRIVEQNLESFKVGTVCKILVNSVIDERNLYFFLKNEFADIREFLDTFNDICQDSISPCHDSTIGAEVSVYEDENFCRGRIIDHLKDENVFTVFLVDFGTTINRPQSELYKLSDNFKTQQPAVYKGKLAYFPEHIHIKTQEQLVDRVCGRFQDARVVKVHDDSVDLLLLQ